MENPYQRTYRLFNNQIHRLGDYLKRVSLPGFEGVALYSVFWFFVKGLQKGSLNTRAASIGFNFMLALGPAIIFILSVIPYLPIPNIKEELFDILQVMPADSFIAMESLLDEIFSRQIGLPLFGLLVAIFFAVKGMHGIIESFNATYHEIETRSWFRQLLTSIGLLIILLILLSMAITLLIYNKMIFSRFVEMEWMQKDFVLYALMVVKWIILVSLTFFSISFLYYLGPSRKTEYRFFSAGSSTATILTILASLGFTYFVNNYAPFIKFFGSIGVLIAFMLWLNFIALTLLIGFELNASIKNVQLKGSEP